MQTRTTLFLAFTLLSAASIGFARDAGACSDTGIGPTSVLRAYAAPYEGARIPHDAPALFFHPNGGCAKRSADFVKLTDATGASVPFTTKEALGHGFELLPTSKLTPLSKYTLAYPTGCGGEYPTETTFETGPSEAIPSKALQITATISNRDHDGDAICSTGERWNEQSAYFSISALPEFRSFVPLTRIETLVDGVTWAASQYGDFHAVETPSVRKSVDNVSASCGGSTGRPLVSAGKHKIEIRAHVAGAKTDPEAVRFEIDLTCPPGVPASPPGVPGAPGTPPDPGASPGADTSGSGGNGGAKGCSAGRAANGGGLIVAAAIVGFVAVAARRRRRH